MQIKTNELTRTALDWTVAVAEGHDMEFFQVVDAFMPSIDWQEGGPIIEREWLDVTPWPNESDEDFRWQCKQHDSIECVAFGPTPLIAAMRCYVASMMGEEVEVPHELVA